MTRSVVEVLVMIVVFSAAMLGVGIAAWSNGGLMMERDMWRREALASQAERANTERKLQNCEGRRGR